MAEDSRQTPDEPHPPVSSRHRPYDSSDSPFQPVTDQAAKGKLHQQRQKCELRRLLKHTHPELKRLDDVLDEELAEVLSCDAGGAAGESGYEGEVLSRRLIFENCATTDARFAPKQPVEKSENRKNFEIQGGESMKHTEEDETRIDVQAARRVFEGHSVSTLRQNAEELDSEVSVLKEQRGKGQKSKEEGKNKTLQNSSTALEPPWPLLPHSPGQKSSGTDGSLYGDETRLLNLEAEDKIQTSAALSKNNPFITANVELELKSHNATGDSGEHQERVTANVKKRTYLFESLPFDKIKHQNKDEVEAMVENIKGTLNCLHRSHVMHSGGAIIEVSETMMAKKAKFTLSDVGPVINYDEVAEGGAQNFILQLVPRAHLKPRITYLKEDKKGRIEATIVNVGLDQETECKTAQLVQVVEDILHQDNSLRKGVIIQEDQGAWAEVMVYSLYKYFDEEDVKRYLPPQMRAHEDQQPESRDPEPSKAEAEPLTSSSKNTPKDQTLAASIGPEITTGNVKLFKTCIEKGDFECLKGFHADSTAEEFPPVNNGATQTDNYVAMSEWVPVDVEKLKKMFSVDQNPTPLTQKEGQTSAQRTAGTSAGQTRTSSSTGNSTAPSSQTCAHLQTQDDHVIHKAELGKVVADCDEISNLQIAINTLQQATTEAKTLQEKQKSLREVTRQKSHVEQSTETLPKESNNNDHLFTSFHIPAEFTLDISHKNTEENPKGTKTEAHAESCSGMGQARSSGCESSSEAAAAEQEGEEGFQGKLQAALESLQRSNLNVTRGDFKAAMIYRSSSKHHKNTVDASPQAPTEKQARPFSEPKSAQLRQESADTSRQGSAEKRRSVGPKPTIPPKPEHLKEKRDVQPTNKSLNEETNEEKLNSIANVKSGPVTLQTNQLRDEARQQVKGSIGCMETDKTEEKLKNGQQNFTVAEKKTQDSSIEDSMTEENKLSAHFCEEGQKMFKKFFKNVPIKPRRVKIANPEHKTPKQNIRDTDSHIPTGISLKNPSAAAAADAEGKDTNEKSENQRSKVEMRERKRRPETEAERRQRLSVHMDEIVKGNVTAAMEIFDNLRKQEELQSFLSRVEEIEKDTSGVDVRSLRGIFENIPDWVASSNRKKPNKVKVEKQEERMALTPDSATSKPSMAHVFGNLERASEEILNLKEQTLARLLDIEEAIKKALYSVSTLKSESDIAGLSSLFKESFGTVQGSPASANISQISIGSCRAKPVVNRESPAEGSTSLPWLPAAATGVASAKHQASPTSSPAFISIQSAARPPERADTPAPEPKCCPTRQHSSNPEEKFLTTATLTCDGEMRGGQKESCHNPKRELSVLEVQTDHEGNTITVTERTDPCGNTVYSSRASTLIPAPPGASVAQAGLRAPTSPQHLPTHR